MPFYGLALLLVMYLRLLWWLRDTHEDPVCSEWDTYQLFTNGGWTIGWDEAPNVALDSQAAEGNP